MFCYLFTKKRKRPPKRPQKESRLCTSYSKKRKIQIRLSSSGRILNRRTLPLKVFQDGPHRAQNPAIDFLPEFHQQNKATEKLPQNSSGMGLVKYKRTCNAASREETRLLLEMGLLLLLAGFVGYSK